MASFKKHGTGTETNTECDITTWLGYVRKIGSNPFQAIDGIEMRVRLAYFDIVVRKYVDEAKVQYKVKGSLQRWLQKQKVKGSLSTVCKSSCVQRLSLAQSCACVHRLSMLQ